ncbi:MAG: YlbF family regulator [Christensenellales bacterium]|jgi:cell fate (sporulation/competence/biofilm development) regulator YlbF (YheA/YmcA/DUF963 family)
MNVYDQAHALARSLKESDQYKEYARLREIAYADQTNSALLDEYKKLQFRLQAKMASGEQLPDDDMQRLNQIATLLQLNREAGEYLLAEFNFQKLLADVFRILADVSGINPDMFAR